MLYKIVKGRLGNQMFQYATMRAFQIEYFPTEKMVFNFKYVRKKGSEENGFKNTLKDFNIVEIEEDDKIDLKTSQKIELIRLAVKLGINKRIYKDNEEFNKIREKIEKTSQRRLNKKGIYWFTNGYEKFDFQNTRAYNKVFYGYFESIKYFDRIKDVLRNEFSPKYPELDKNELLYQEIRKSNSVCVSIRRGDFITNPIYKKKHYICDENYFKKAIKIMNGKIENPKYFVFSDDVDWVKNNMKFPEGTMFEDGTDPVWEKLRLMYSCKNFIISNSSFSWWAQYLSIANNKIVIAPRKWLNDQDNPDIYEKSWILI